jgi:hypothetical protein
MYVCVTVMCVRAQYLDVLSSEIIEKNLYKIYFARKNVEILWLEVSILLLFPRFFEYCETGPSVWHFFLQYILLFVHELADNVSDMEPT